jgi:uncharacterized alpha-E superfamily protein
MLSRVADSLYWMSRYLERAEHTGRLLDVNLSLMLDKLGTSAERRWRRLLLALGSPSTLVWDGNYQRLAESLTFDGTNPASVSACIITARENARQVRDEISSEQWQQLNRMYHQVMEAHTEGELYADVQKFLPFVIDGIHLFHGITDTTMSHGEGWNLIQLGRYIERAAATANLLDHYYHEHAMAADKQNDPYHYLEDIGLLRCCTAFEAYCKVYTADLTSDQVLEFLLLNREFPHSVRYSVDCVRQALLAIQQESGHQPADELTRLTGRLQASLSFVDISDVLSQDVDAYLRNILQQCRRIHDRFYRVYINYSVQTALAM